MKLQISLAIRPVWSDSSLSTRKLGSLATHWAHREDKRRLVFAGKTSLRWAHMLFYWFCHEVAKLSSFVDWIHSVHFRHDFSRMTSVLTSCLHSWKWSTLEKWSTRKRGLLLKERRSSFVPFRGDPFSRRQTILMRVASLKSVSVSLFWNPYHV